MTNELDSRVLDLVAEALAIEPAELSQWLQTACGDDQQLRLAAEVLLGFDDDARDLLQLSSQASPRSASGLTQSGSIGSLQPGDQLGDYRIEEQLGAGGMGIVYQAKQLSLNRLVALKVLPAHLRNAPQALARFRREVEAAARLRHENIVAVHTSGDDGSNSYFAMELIVGLTLAEVLTSLRDNPIPELQINSPWESPNQEQSGTGQRPAWLAKFFGLDSSANGQDVNSTSPISARPIGNYFERVAGLFAEVADGLHYAHGNQIVHRDIKPSNLLMSEDGRLHISDFGLARILAEPGMTQTGDFVGTPFYMAPEQVSSKVGEIDGRTDIYSLGATLYEMLTLRPPFPGSTRDEVIAQVISEEPLPPRRINKRIPRDLETVCLQALEKHPERRYQSAAQMGEDLRLFASHFPIATKRSGVAVRSMKWCRRHRAMAVSLTAAAGLGLIAAMLAYSAHESTKEKALAEQQRDDVKARASEIEQNLKTAEAAVMRARQSEQERVFEEALLAAMRGDQPAVASAIAEAEALGAAADRLHVLRGQNAMFTADFADGLEELEAAIKINPHNLAAYALMAEIYARVEQWETSRELVEKVQAMTPNSTEDLILKGRMESYHDVEQAEQTLNQAIEGDKRNVPARLIRGIIRAKRAYGKLDAVAAEQALVDFRQASSFLEETSYLLGELLRVNLNAATAYDARGNAEAKQEHMNEAKDAADRLGKFAGEYQAHRWRAYYFDQAGDLDQAILEWQAIQDKTIGYLIMCLYRAGRFEEALVACDKYGADSETGTADFCHSFTVAAKADSREELIEDFQFETQLAWNRSSTRKTVFMLWSLAGDGGRARQEVRNIGIDPDSPPFARRIYEYTSGDLTDWEYLEKVAHSRFQLANAHLLIGFNHLREGQRRDAREHFQQVVDLRLNFEFFHAVANALLVQMEREPDWPRWIP